MRERRWRGWTWHPTLSCPHRALSFTTCSPGAFVVMGFAGAVIRFFIISNSHWGKDQPQTLRYAITQNCSTGADVRQFNQHKSRRSASRFRRSGSPLPKKAIGKSSALRPRPKGQNFGSVTPSASNTWTLFSSKRRPTLTPASSRRAGSDSTFTCPNSVST